MPLEAPVTRAILPVRGYDMVISAGCRYLDWGFCVVGVCSSRSIVVGDEVVGTLDLNNLPRPHMELITANHEDLKKFIYL